MKKLLLLITILILEIGCFVAQSGNETSNDSILAETYSHIADSLRRTGNFTEASTYYEKALSIKLILYPDRPEDLSMALANLGTIYFKLGNYSKALECYNTAIDKASHLKIENCNLLGQLYSNIAIVYKTLGNYTKALEYFDKAGTIIEKDSGRNEELAVIHHNTAIVYSRIANYQLAIEYFNKSIEYRKKAGLKALSTTLNRLAKACEMLGNFNEAEKYYRQCIDSRKQQGDKYFKLASVYAEYGRFCIARGKDKEGLEYYSLALSMYRKTYGDRHPYIAHCLGYIGDYYLDKQEPTKALHYYQESMISNFTDFTDTCIYTFPPCDTSLGRNIFPSVFSDLELLITFKKKALAFEILFHTNKNDQNLIAGLQSLDYALRLIGKIKTGYQEEESQLYISNQERSTYDDAIHMAYMLYKLTGKQVYAETAFEYAERSKVNILLLLLLQNRALITGKVPDSLLIQESTLTIGIASIEKQLFDELQHKASDSTRVKAWKSELFELNRKYENLLSRLEENYPVYNAVKYDQRIPSLREIQIEIPPDETILEYVLTDSVIYIFAITATGFEIYSEKADSNFYYALDLVLNCLYSVENQDDESWFMASSLLYNKLIVPASASIKGTKLRFIPDKKLAFLPFDALLTSLPEKGVTNYSNLPYLLRTFEVSYNYSIMLKDFFRNDPNTKTKLLAFAPGYNQNNANKNNFYDLEANTIEAQIISDFFPGETFIGSGATESVFKQRLSNNMIVHFASHAVVDFDNPLYSYLMFANENINVEDGKLYVYELYNMHIGAKMIVLSGCNTGSGKLNDGEGIMSIARAFVQAECRSVVYSMWDANDFATKTIMAEFYERLAAGESKSEALRRAKLAYIENTSPLFCKPNYWAGITLIGDPSSLANNNAIFSTLLPYAIIIIIILSFIILYAAIKRKVS